MKKYSIKIGIMEAMKALADQEVTVSEVAKQMNRMGIFTPYSMDVHLRQLFAQGAIRRISRGVYIYDKPKEMPLFEGTTEALDQLTLC